MKDDKAQVQAQEQENVIPYEGLPAQVALMCMDRATEYVMGYAKDDGETPYSIRKAYEEVAKAMLTVKKRLLKVTTLDAQRKVPCYTIENGRLVRMRMEDLLKRLEEEGGEIDI